MKLLVLTSEAISADQLRDALPNGVDPQQAEVMLVAPALQESAIRFWFSDVDDAIARADAVREESVQRLGADDVAVSADTGEADPMDAIEDALETFDADRIVLFTRAGDGQRYREDLDSGEVSERFGRPVDRAQV
jgi:hypothetical protein